MVLTLKFTLGVKKVFMFLRLRHLKSGIHILKKMKTFEAIINLVMCFI